jgi:hypothetical protein
LVYYAKGVNGFWGGFFGKGLDDIITGAYEWLIDKYAAGMRYSFLALAVGHMQPVVWPVSLRNAVS